MKKKLFCLILLCIVLITTGCEREIDQDKIEMHADSLVYVIGEDKPYTGVVIVEAMGIKMKTFYKDGNLDMEKQMKYSDKISD